MSETRNDTATHGLQRVSLPWASGLYGGNIRSPGSDSGAGAHNFCMRCPGGSLVIDMTPLGWEVYPCRALDPTEAPSGADPDVQAMQGDSAKWNEDDAAQEEPGGGEE